MPLLGMYVIASTWVHPAERAPEARPTRSESLAGPSATADHGAAIVTLPPRVSRPPRTVDALPLVSMTLPRIPASVDRVVLIAWPTLTIVLAAILALANLGLRRDRRHWKPATIADCEVVVAPDFGPAVVGILSPAIVVPEWALLLDGETQRVMVLHECEHVRARDQLLIATGIVAAIAMPWNPAVWLSLRGLRRAVEVDCDARVVSQGVARAQYASVLLDAWSRATGRLVIGAAFVEESSRLGQRVEHLMRPKPRRRMMKTALGISAASVIVMLACEVPVPQQNSDTFAPYPLVVIDGIVRPELPPRQAPRRRLRGGLPDRARRQL